MSYRYNVRTGLTQIKTNTKRYIFSGLSLIALAVGGSALPAAAASNGYCGSSANGCDAAYEAGAQCGTGAGSGAFGVFGPGNNMKGGADGRQTGINNSAVCGNREF